MPTTLRNTDILFNDSSTQTVGTSGDFKFNSGYGSEAVAYGCRAWVNFNGTGTITTRASGNVTSITDNGVGDYTVNFTNAMPDSNFVASGMAGTGTALNQMVCLNDLGKTTSSQRFLVADSGGNGVDRANVNVVIFR